MTTTSVETVREVPVRIPTYLVVILIVIVKILT